MTRVASDPVVEALVRSYLERLHAAGWTLRPERRLELVDEVREHIDRAIADDGEKGRASEVAARNVLERLGPPEEIVRAEIEGGPYDAAAIPPIVRPRSPAPSSGLLEVAAIVLVAVGGFLIPVVGSLIGIVLAWASPAWTTKQKTVATGLSVAPMILLPLFVLISDRF